MTDILGRTADHKINKIDVLLPWLCAQRMSTRLATFLREDIMANRKAVLATVLLALSLLFSATATAQETIRIDGSSGVRPLAKALGKAFAKTPGGMAVEVGKGLSTKARLKALAAGKIDIATASHGADPKELAKRGMIVHTIAKIAVIFGVNSGVSVDNLTSAQICDIYSGKVTTWKQIGGTDLPIHARTRPDKEVDAAVMRKGIPCLTTLKFASSVKVNKKSGQMARDLAATAGAIGMTTTTRVRRSKGKIKAVSYNGVAPSVANVEAGKYLFTREAYLVTKANASAKVEAFLAFVKSAGGRSVLKANEAIPVN